MTSRKRLQAGFSMIEVLITIAILIVGLLGLAGLQTNVAAAEFEAYQRAQALVLAQDIADRISANKRNAANYVMDDIGIPAVEAPCGGLTDFKLDLCEISNMLVGTSEKQGAGGPTVGGMLGARACITNPQPNVYVITIAWQGFRPGGVPIEKCGADQYGKDNLRRTVSFPIRVATLTVT